MIKFLGQEYSVKMTPEAIGGGEEKNRAFLGSTEETRNLIVVDGTLPDSRQDEVFMHELIHLADMTLPEFAVQSLGRNLYGLFTENGIIKPGFVRRLSDGDLSADEMARINEDSQRQSSMLQQMGMMRERKRTSAASWDFDASKYSADQLAAACLVPGRVLTAIRHPDGTVNINAVALVANRLVSNHLDLLSRSEIRMAASRLVDVYRLDLGEEAPTYLTQLAA